MTRSDHSAVIALLELTTSGYRHPYVLQTEEAAGSSEINEDTPLLENIVVAAAVAEVTAMADKEMTELR